MPSIFATVAKVLLTLIAVLGAGFLVLEKKRADLPTVPLEQKKELADSASATTSTEVVASSGVLASEPLGGDNSVKREGVFATSTSQNTSPSALVALAKKKILAPVLLATTSMAVVSPAVPFSFDSSWRDSVVNLLCTNRYGGEGNVFSGSGILIDSRGVILTNAHVAIEFLFADWPSPSLYECSVRVGSPASPLYRASLLYIPDEFVADEVANLYLPDDKRIYGKNDYALLLITGRTNPSASLPESFSHLPLSTGPALPVNSSVFLIGYPASFLGGIAIQRDLYLLSSPAVVNIVRAIEGDTQPGVIAFGGNVIGQHGSSGGGVIGPGGTLAGLMTFFDKGYGYTTNERILNAITTGYIDRDLKQDTGASLAEFLAEGDFLARSKKFMSEQGLRYERLFANAWRERQGVIIPGVSY